MKIAIIGHKRIPGREGGIEVVVEELATRLVKKGNKVVVYNRHKRGYKSPKKYNGVKIVDIPTIETKYTDAAVYSFLASICVLFGRYDVVHYHGIGPSVFLIIPNFFGIKTVVTVHGLNYKTPKWKGLGEKFIKFGEQITAKFANKIIVLSKEQQLYFKEKYNRETEYIPNATAIYKPKRPNIIYKKYGLIENNYLLCVSRIVPGKGLDHLIKAYKKIGGNLKLIIAGAPSYTTNYSKELMDLAKNDNRIKFVGHVEKEELIELYSNAKLFVFSSEAEGMPMCLLEAMSFDCRCLVSDIPENLEVGKQYVKSFETGNINDMANKIMKCLKKQKWSPCGHYIKENFSWNGIVDSTIECYKRK